MDGVFKFFLSKLIFLVFLCLIAYIIAFKGSIVAEYKQYQLHAEKQKTDIIVSQPEKEKKLKFIDKTQAVDEPSLKNARLFFWDEQYARSMKEYRLLIALDNENVDYHGELANVLYGTGLMDDAASELYITAKLLINQKDYYRVQKIQAVLSTLDSKKSTEISNYLNNAKSIN